MLKRAVCVDLFCVLTTAKEFVMWFYYCAFCYFLVFVRQLHAFECCNLYLDITLWSLSNNPSLSPLFFSVANSAQTTPVHLRVQKN
jgi:hypothetical protein